MSKDLITLHRNSIGRDFEATKAYYEKEMGWGTPAYHFWIGSDGGIKQWQSLLRNAWHAGPTWNPIALGIAIHGDMRARPPTGAQMGALMDLLGTLCYAFDLVPTREWPVGWTTVPTVNSHEELAKKEGRVWKCPGENLNVESLRKRIELPRLPSLAGMSVEQRVTFCGWF